MRAAEDTIDIARLAGRRVVSSISGGKDSAAMSLWLTEQGIEHDRVFMDTGWEHEKTYEYLRGELTRVIGPITEIRGPILMEELILRRKMFPSKQRRYCTQELKVFPMQAHIRALVEAGAEVLNTVGIRRAESASRSKMAEWEWSDGFDCEIWRPIIAWSADDVIAIHRRHNLAPNPLYLMGASRVGCWPCIYARKSEVRLIADVDPGRIERIRDLESKVLAGQLARRSARLRVFEEGGAAALGTTDRRALLDESGEVKPFQAPSWFQSPLGREGVYPIDKVVEWSRTSRGGRQVEMFAADPADAGCMRWGLCDTESA